MKKLVVVVVLIVACVIGWYVYDRVSFMSQRMEMMAERMQVLADQLQESNRLLSHVEAATAKLVKALP